MTSTSSGDLKNVVQTHLSTSADGAYTLIDGRTASGVTGVTLVRQDGQDVVTTVEDGWFVAWWPGSADTTSAQVTTASGTTTETLTPDAKQGPGTGSCQPTPLSSTGAGTGGQVVCRSSGSAPATPGNTAHNEGNSGAGNSRRRQLGQQRQGRPRLSRRSAGPSSARTGDRRPAQVSEATFTPSCGVRCTTRPTSSSRSAPLSASVPPSSRA